MNNLESALAEKRDEERKTVIEVSEAVVKPDTRKLPPTRVGKKQLSTWVHPEVHTDLKVIAAKEGTTLEGVMLKAVNLLRIQHGLPPTA